ncbi:hypothetical protein FHQ18_09960 [Deferribacter autotrophicus]|uniref:Pentraxin (PTX) domain-containing protein n=1 Tax=Deferribacter autotrophicus TaxID=500465 RepID=A0A5A8F1U1_9BACT|nr:DUF6701 domain-containing protein [Deferribacter autotrophicus]KAA0257362.1 hypothetical protein FHQ18_09960 [Deferribacter autotrophicus]
MKKVKDNNMKWLSVLVFLLLTSTLYAAVPPPIAEWRMDECQWNGIVGEVKDSSGNNYNGTAYNSTTISGKICRAGDFSKDSKTDYVSLDYRVMNGLDDFSVSVWIKTSNKYDYQTILSGKKNNSWFNNELLIWLKNATTLEVWVNSKKASIDIPDIADDQWHHLVWTRSGKQNCLYVDGEQIECITIARSDGIIEIANGGLIVGQDQDKVGSNFDEYQDFEGKIDELKIFDTVLTASQIQEIYNNEKADKNYDNSERTCENCQLSYPIVEYHFDECSWNGTIGEIKDNTSNGYNATAQNDSTTIDNGKICKGGDLTDNNYIVPEKDIPIGNEYTISLWIKFPLDEKGHTDYSNNPNREIYFFNIADRPTENDDFIYFTMEKRNNKTLLTWTVQGDIIADSEYFPSDLNDWHMITFVAQNGITKLYIDGNYYNYVTAVSYGKLSLIGASDYNNDENGQTIGAYIDEFKIFNYALTSSEIKDIYDNEFFGKNWDGTERICQACAYLHHYLIEHDGTGLTCQPENITVKACADYNCTTFYSGATLTLTATNNATWVGGSDKTLTNGYETFQLSDKIAETVKIGAINLNPDAPVECFNTTTSDNSCDITFYNAGFIFDFPNTDSCEISTTKIKAVRTDDTTYKCVPAFTGSIPIYFWFDYSIPNNNPNNILLLINNQHISNDSNSPTSIPLTFDDNATAAINAVYKDAGKLTIHALFDNATAHLEGVDTVVFKPAKFIFDNLSNSTINPAYNASCSNDSCWASISPFKKAGEDFSFTIKAVCADNTTTPNYKPLDINGNDTNILISAIFLAPDNGSNATNYLHLANVPASNFSNGQVELIEKFNEVGVIELTAKQDDYLGAGSISSSIEVGRFIPHHFKITSKDNGTLADAATNFTYTEQTTTYSTVPQFEITAQNKDNQTTQNYKDSFFKLTLSSFNITSPTTDDYQLGRDGVSKVSLQINRAIANLISHNNGTATYIFGSDNITYIKDNNSQIAPFTPHFTFTIDNITDSDGVDAINLPDNISVSGSEMRYGRLKIYDNYGPETDNLTLTANTEYWDGNYWKLNSDDSHISINPDDFILGNFTDELNSGETSITGTSGINNGEGSLTLSEPGDNNYGTVDICISSTASFYDYLNDNDSCGTATFGIYRGRDRVIEWKEVPAKP